MYTWIMSRTDPHYLLFVNLVRFLSSSHDGFGDFACDRLHGLVCDTQALFSSTHVPVVHETKLLH